MQRSATATPILNAIFLVLLCTSLLLNITFSSPSSSPSTCAFHENISWFRRVDSFAKVPFLPASVQIDSEGNTYVAGIYNITTTSDVGGINPQTQTTIRVASAVLKYNRKQNTILWQKSFSSPTGNVVIKKMKIDTTLNKNDVYVAGDFSDKFEVDAGGLYITKMSAVAQPDNDVFIAKLQNGSGKADWGFAIGGYYEDSLSSMSLHTIENRTQIILSGLFEQHCMIGRYLDTPITLISSFPNSKDAFLVSMEENGHPNFAQGIQSFGNYISPKATCLNLQKQQIVMAGVFSNTISFDRTAQDETATKDTLVSAGGVDGFIASFDVGSGNMTNKASIGSFLDENVQDLACIDDGAVLLYQTYECTSDKPTAVPASSIFWDDLASVELVTNMVYVNLDKKHEQLFWRKKIRNAGKMILQVVDDSIYLLGDFTSKVLIGDASLESATSDFGDLFLVKMDKAGYIDFIHRYGGQREESLVDVHIGSIAGTSGALSIERIALLMSSNSITPFYGISNMTMTSSAKRFMAATLDLSFLCFNASSSTSEILPFISMFTPVAAQCAQGTIPAALDLSAAPSLSADDLIQLMSQVHCTTCNVGFYAPQGSTQCIPCEPGSFSFEQGSKTCAFCPAGTVGPRQNGTFTGYSESTFCKGCPSGFFSANRGANSCSPCPLGTYSQIENATSPRTCLPCPKGYYTPTMGAPECVPCPFGELCSFIEPSKQVTTFSLWAEFATVLSNIFFLLPAFYALKVRMYQEFFTYLCTCFWSSVYHLCYNTNVCLIDKGFLQFMDFFYAYLSFGMVFVHLLGLETPAYKVLLQNIYMVVLLSIHYLNRFDSNGPIILFGSTLALVCLYQFYMIFGNQILRSNIIPKCFFSRFFHSDVGRRLRTSRRNIIFSIIGMSLFLVGYVCQIVSGHMYWLLHSVWHSTLGIASLILFHVYQDTDNVFWAIELFYFVISCGRVTKKFASSTAPPSTPVATPTGTTLGNTLPQLVITRPATPKVEDPLPSPARTPTQKESVNMFKILYV